MNSPRILFNILAPLAIIFFAYSHLSAQTLTVSSSQLNFGTAFETAPDSLPLTIYNNMGHAVDVTGIKFYTTYGTYPFASDASGFTIPDGSSQQVWIKFSPLHNIFHNSEMVIENNGLRGYVHVHLTAQGQYSNAYYDSTTNLSEENLKTALHSITGNGYVSLGYNLARDDMFMWIDNQMVNGQGASQNTLESVYTGTLAIGYTDRTDCQNNYNFNTEHTFPQSFFSQSEPMRSDLHHLFPTDNSSNNVRADNPFGVVSNPTWTNGGSSATSSLFEPRNQQKGATARALMYFVLRYQDYASFFSPQESILRTWHQTFGPTAIERKRNHDIDSVQHNRNPFVDYPQFIERITSVSNFSVAPVVHSMDLTEDTIIYGLVQPGNPADFHYVMVNNGNTDIHFTGFGLSNTAILTFQSGGNDTVLAAGNAIELTIRLTASNTSAIHENLFFQTDVPGQNAVSIPIYANDSVVTGIQDNESGNLSLGPNPADRSLFIHYRLLHDAAATITDIMGKTIQSFILRKNNSSVTIDLSKLDPGAYFLKTESVHDFIFRKFIKQ